MRRLRLFVLALLGLPLLFSPAAAAADIDLTTDAKGSLFAAGELSPDYKGARCVQVKWTGNAVPRTVGIAADVTGKLASYLVLSIEVGTGGSFASCNGFEGKTIYHGTLADFGKAHANVTSQLAAGKVSADAGTISYRLSVSVLDVNDAQALSAKADFVFAAIDEARVSAPPTSPPEVAEPVGPSDEPTTEPGTSVPSSHPTSPPNRQGELPADDPAQGGQGGPAVKVPLTPEVGEPGIFANPVRAVMHLVENVRELAEQAAAPVVKGVAFGAWSLPWLLGFLLLQNYFDKRDPKLAQAPVFSSPSLPFDDTYSSASAAEAES